MRSRRTAWAYGPARLPGWVAMSPRRDLYADAGTRGRPGPFTREALLAQVVGGEIREIAVEDEVRVVHVLVENDDLELRSCRDGDLLDGVVRRVEDVVDGCRDEE